MTELLAALLATLVGVAPASEGEIKVDGFFQEWAERPALPLSHAIRGDLSGPGDLEGEARLAWDAAHLYVALEVKDDLFTHGRPARGDRVELRITPGGKRAKPVRLNVVLNDLEGTPPVVYRGKKPLAGARTYGTTRVKGWAVELSVPLAALPGLHDGPFGFALLVFDTDYDSTKTEAVLSTAPLPGAGDPLAGFRLDATSSALEAYYAERGGRADALRFIETNIAGDDRAEAVTINPRDLAIVGAGLPGDTLFLYFTHGWGVDTTLRKVEVLDLDGRPGQEILVERDSPGWSGARDTVVEVYGLHDGYLKRMFALQIAEVGSDYEARARYRLRKGRDGARRFVVERARVKGRDADTWDTPTGDIQYAPIPLPWDGRGPVTFVLMRDAWRTR